jgi:hypothetical protein
MSLKVWKLLAVVLFGAASVAGGCGQAPRGSGGDSDDDDGVGGSGAASSSSTQVGSGGAGQGGAGQGGAGQGGAGQGGFGQASSSAGQGGFGQTSSSAGQGGFGQTSSSSSQAASTVGSGGSGGINQATPIDFNDPVSGDIFPTGVEHFYTFNGTKGQFVGLFVRAQALSGGEFDPQYIDTIVTLYNNAQAPIAENDDPLPRFSNDSELLTVLPYTGKYYVGVTECWTRFQNLCAPPMDKLETAYELNVFDLDPTLDGVVQSIEPDNVPAEANVMEYANPNGQYIITSAYGGFQSSADVDVFTVSLPLDISVTAGERAVGYFNFMPDGPAGNGSTTSSGVISLLDAATFAPFARVDATLTDEMSPPIPLGQDYLLVIQHPGGASGTNDFYVFKHYGGSSNPLEANEAGNNALAGAEPLTLAQGTTSYFIEGDIISTSDIDNFSVAVPAGTTKVTAVCGAERSGSGVRNFTVSIRKTDNTQVASKVETAAVEALLSDVAVPVGATTLILRVSAGATDAAVTSRFYRCGVHFAP